MLACNQWAWLCLIICMQFWNLWNNKVNESLHYMHSTLHYIPQGFWHFTEFPYIKYTYFHAYLFPAKFRRVLAKSSGQLWKISWKMTLYQSRGGGGYSHKWSIWVCAAPNPPLFTLTVRWTPIFLSLSVRSPHKIYRDSFVLTKLFIFSRKLVI